jgi:hypothetical protein
MHQKVIEVIRHVREIQLATLNLQRAKDALAAVKPAYDFEVARIKNELLPSSDQEAFDRRILRAATAIRAKHICLSTIYNNEVRRDNANTGIANVLGLDLEDVEQ